MKYNHNILCIIQIVFFGTMIGLNSFGQNNKFAIQAFNPDSISDQKMQNFLNELPDSIANDSTSGIYRLHSYLLNYPDSVKSDTNSVVYKLLSFSKSIIQKFHSDSLLFEEWLRRSEEPDTNTRYFESYKKIKKIKFKFLLTLCPEKEFSLDMIFANKDGEDKRVSVLNGYYFEHSDTLFLKNLNDSLPYILIKNALSDYKSINISSIIDQSDFELIGYSWCVGNPYMFMYRDMQNHDSIIVSEPIYIPDTNLTSFYVSGKYINETEETSIQLLPNRVFKILLGDILFSEGKWEIKGGSVVLTDQYNNHTYTLFCNMNNLYNLNAPTTRYSKFNKSIK